MDLKEIGYEGVNWIQLAQDMYQCQALVREFLDQVIDC
jgi:hypothetical protein